MQFLGKLHRSDSSHGGPEGIYPPFHARAKELVDEHPDAYKNIDTVMADQADLVEIEHTLTQIFNYKG